MINKSNTEEVNRDLWRTPKFIFNFANEYVGGFDYDSACSENNCLATPIWIKDHHKDALKSDWEGKVWCNPPYSKIAPWVDKALNSKALVAMLIPSPNGESYYDNLILKSHEIHIIGRIGFIDCYGKTINGNPRGSSLFLINSGSNGMRDIVYRDALKSRYET